MTLEYDYCPYPTLREYIIYINNKNIHSKINEAKKRGLKMKKETILKWFNQLLDAVEYLHQHKFICQEILPENIFILNKDKDIKLGFPNLGKFQSSIMSQLYTSNYDAPDDEFSPYTDVWTLGVILYELCRLEV